MMLVLNMYDELEARGGSVDTDRLGEILGIPVVVTVAPRNEGTSDLVEALSRARVPDPQVLQIGPPTQVDTVAGPQPQLSGAQDRLSRVNEIISETYAIDQPKGAPFGVRLGFWAMHPVKGMAFLAAILLTVFWFVGLFGAGTLVDALEIAGFGQRLSPLAIRATDAVLPFPHQHVVENVPYTLSLPVSPAHDMAITRMDREVIRPPYTVPADAQLTVWQNFLRLLHDFMVGPFGVITMALSYAFAIVLPIVTIFFFVFSILEDSGYFARMSIMLNRAFRVMGLNGKAVLPMILGLGCVTMATMTTRILQTRKERLVTTMLLALAVPCSAQLGVLLALMAALTPAGALVWLALMGGILLAVGWLSARVFPGQTSDFILEIPPMRRPQIGNVLMKTGTRLDWYLREVIPVFVVGTAVLFVMDRLNLLARISVWAEPLVTGWLGLPADMSNAFLVGFMRRDFGAVYVLDAVSGPNPLLTPHQILVAMVTITLFMPCFATLLIIAKEHGKRVALGMVLFIFPFALFVGGILNHVGRWLQTI
jgi:ferrous iron transport protein B